MSPDDLLVRAYERCLALAAHGFLDPAQADADAAARFRVAVYRLLRAEGDRLPAEWFTQALQRLDHATRALNATTAQSA